MKVLLVSLIFVLNEVNSITLCNKEVSSTITEPYSCLNEDETCCPQGCCPKPFVLPLVSIAFGAKICILILFVFFAAGVVKCFQYLRQHHLGYQKGSFKTTSDEKNKQNQTEMVAINMPDVVEEST